MLNHPLVLLDGIIIYFHMKDKDYKKLMLFRNMQGSGLVPDNDAAREYNEQLKYNQVVPLKDISVRDLSLHKCYFAFLKEVYGYLPLKFRKKVPEHHFYNWLKIMKDEYEVIYTFKDKPALVEYESISFGRMSNSRFKEYVKEQIPVIYELFQTLLPADFANNAIETIEENFEKMFSKL